MESVTVSTRRKKEIIDITDRIREGAEKSGIQGGLCSVFVAHTTAAVTTADLDPGTDEDMLDAFKAMMPKLQWRHPHDPAHAPDHIMSSLIGPSVSIPVRDGTLVLGTWQRIVLVELDGPRERSITVTYLSS